MHAPVRSRMHTAELISYPVLSKKRASLAAVSCQVRFKCACGKPAGRRRLTEVSLATVCSVTQATVPFASHLVAGWGADQARGGALTQTTRCQLAAEKRVDETYINQLDGECL